MSQRRRTRPAAVAVAALVATAAGCGSVPGQAAPRVAPPQPPGLATSMTSPGGTWATAVLGGSAAAYDNFWQIFVRPASSATWRLVTPPGVASNGGLVMAAEGGSSVIAGFRPTQGLTFSPLAVTVDDGATWSSRVLDAALAGVPDALAAAPGGGGFLALLSGGQVQQAGRGAAAWSPLTSLRALAATPGGRRCGLTGLTAVAFSPAGAAQAAGTCARPGVVAIFTRAGRTWQAVAAALPARLAGWRVQVLRLAATSAGETALLAARSGRRTDLLVAWTGDGTRWSVSAPVSLGTAAPRATGLGAAGAAWVLLASGQADMIAGRGARWQPLPRTPSRTALLALPASGGVDALAPDRSKLTVWRLAGRPTAWARAQVLNVPVQYGSSG